MYLVMFTVQPYRPFNEPEQLQNFAQTMLVPTFRSFNLFQHCPATLSHYKQSSIAAPTQGF